LAILDFLLIIGCYVGTAYFSGQKRQGGGVSALRKRAERRVVAARNASHPACTFKEYTARNGRCLSVDLVIRLTTALGFAFSP